MFRSQNKRRRAKGHVLISASKAYSGEGAREPLLLPKDLGSWTFGRGTVVWTIWPAVLLHTVFAAVVTSITLRTDIDLAIPQVLYTVLGVVIGFVISYRASSGYDRYWLGRTCWSDIVKNSRTMSRYIWLHIPLKIKKDLASDDSSDAERSMREKLLALELIEGFAVAVKHHLRGEIGIYYEDLYHLVKPLHEVIVPQTIMHEPRKLFYYTCSKDAIV